MKDIVISSKKVQKLVKRELKNRFGKVPKRVQDRVLMGVNNIIKDQVRDLVDEVETYVDVVVQSQFSLDDVYPTERGK